MQIDDMQFYELSMAVSDIDLNPPDGISRSVNHTDTREQPIRHECAACFEGKPDCAILQIPCAHRYCRPCIIRLFDEATRNELHFPAKCCGRPIPVSLVSNILGPELTNLTERKAIEIGTTDRTYCAQAECSTFIPSLRNAWSSLSCPACGKTTCSKCKKAAHNGDCTKNKEVEAVLQIAKEKRWQRCYHCARMVEKIGGCNEITCLCRRKFCYVCGQKWKTCNCGRWGEPPISLDSCAWDDYMPAFHSDRLYDPAHVASYADEYYPPRTVTPSELLHRSLSPAALVKHPSYDDEDLFFPETSSDHLKSRSNDDDRSHPLYKAKPGPNGLYHCPFKDRTECDHKPTPQKCSYDKYLDSHLMRYRCKAKNAPQCAEVRFSSTACRLRHEREAHGLHGHGKMPHLCRFEGCDRASADNGFPRRWNLFDHMKRVHQWTHPQSETDPEVEQPPKPDKENGVEKRKKVTKTGSQPMKKSRSAQGAVQSEHEHEILTLRQHWNNCYARLQAQHQTLQLGDDLAFQQIMAMIDELHTYNVRYKRAQAGQDANGITRFA